MTSLSPGGQRKLRVGSMESFSSRALTKLNGFAAFACWLAITVGLTGLAGCIFHVQALRTIIPGLAAIKANTAVCFIMLGLSLWLQRNEDQASSESNAFSRVLSLIVAAIGLLSFAEFLFGWNLGIDQVLQTERPEESVGSVRPGLMSPISAIELILLGAAVALLDWTTRRKAWPAQFLCLGSGVLSAAALVDFVLKPHHFHTHIALPTVVTLCIFSFSPVCARPRRLMANLFPRDTLAGNSSNLAPPLQETWIRHWAFRYGMAVLMVGIAAVARRLPGTGIPEPLVYITFYPAIMLPALLGGMWPGMLATLLSALCIDYYFLKPVGHFDAKSATDLIGLTLFALEGIGISAIVGFLQRKRKRAADKLLQQTKLLQAEMEASTRAKKEWELTFNTVSDPVMLLDVEQRILRANRATTQLLELAPAEVLGRHCYELVHHTSCPPQTCPVQRMLKSGLEERGDVEEPRLGKIFDVVATPVRNGGGALQGCVHVIRDITERKQAEANLHRLTRTLQALSECTEALMRAKDETSMLQQVCDAVVRVGGYRMAWVGYAEQDEQKSVRPMAWAGEEEGYLKSANISWADVERGRGPTGTAIRTGKSVVCNDTLRDSNFTPWRNEAMRRGYRSSIVLPLQSERGIVGALIIYAGEVQAFEVHEQRLLEEFAANLSYAIAALRARTELQRSEDKLRKAASYTRSLIEASVDPLVAISREGKITDVNRATETVTGVSREQLIGSHFLNYFTEPDLARRGYEQVFAEGVVHDYPLAIRHVSGSITDVLYSATVFKNEQGEVEGVFAAAREVTARKQAEEKARHASLYARSLIEASVDPLVTISREGKITDVNRATESATGVSREQLIGSDFLHYFTEPDQARRGYEQVFAEGFVHDYPLALRHASGRITDVLYNASLFKDEKGDVEGVFAAARDVTARKQAEMALTMSEARYRSLVIATAQIVWSTNPSGEVVEDLPSFQHFTGRTQADLQGWGWVDTLHPDDRERTAQIWSRAVASRTLYDTEYRMRRADGEFRYMSARGVPVMDKDGNIREWVGFCADITERKLAEDEVRKLNSELEERVKQRTAQLEAANKELEAFTYSVSHDLRAPLRHISGFSKILSEEFGPSLPDEAKHHLERIQQGTSRMGALVDDLLNLARVGRQEIRLQVTGLNSLVDEVIALLKPDCEGRQIEWKIGSLPFIECDPGLMKQVLQNLLSNALKFTRPRAVALIEVGQVEQEGGPVIFVRDNGVGFSMKYADKLFGVFQRLHRSEDFEGTGVGLATVQRILQKHGWKIWAESELDKGTTFYFTLAVARSEASRAKATVAGGNS